MAITPRTAQTAASSANVTSLQITAPASLVKGDVLIAVITVAGGTGVTINPPDSSWSAMYVQQNQTTNTAQAGYIKVATDSEPANYTWTFTSGKASGVLNAYVGVDNANPFAGAGARNTGTASTSIVYANTNNRVAENGYPILITSTRNTTGTTTLSTNSSGFTTDGDTCSTTTSPFMQTVIQDQSGAIGLPMNNYLAGNTTVSRSVSYIATEIFLRPDLSTTTTLATDFIHRNKGTSDTGTVSSVNITTGYGGEFLFAFVESDWGSPDTAALSGTGAVSALSWTLLARSNTSHGCAEVWYTPLPNPITSGVLTATSNLSSGTATMWLTTVSFINCAGAGASGTANNVSGNPSCSITTLSPNSWVWGTILDWTGQTTGTVGANQTMVALQSDATDVTSAWTQRQTNTTASAGTSVTINDTAPTITYEMVVAEILASSPRHLSSIYDQAVKRAAFY